MSVDAMWFTLDVRLWEALLNPDTLQYIILLNCHILPFFMYVSSAGSSLDVTFQTLAWTRVCLVWLFIDGKNNSSLPVEVEQVVKLSEIQSVPTGPSSRL